MQVIEAKKQIPKLSYNQSVKTLNADKEFSPSPEDRVLQIHQVSLHSDEKNNRFISNTFNGQSVR